MEQIGFQIVLKTVPVGGSLPTDDDDIDDDGDNDDSFVALFLLVLQVCTQTIIKIASTAQILSFQVAGCLMAYGSERSRPVCRRCRKISAHHSSPPRRAPLAASASTDTI